MFGPVGLVRGPVPAEALPAHELSCASVVAIHHGSPRQRAERELEPLRPSNLIRIMRSDLPRSRDAIRSVYGSPNEEHSEDGGANCSDNALELHPRQHALASGLPSAVAVRHHPPERIAPMKSGEDDEATADQRSDCCVRHLVRIGAREPQLFLNLLIFRIDDARHSAARRHLGLPSRRYTTKRSRNP